MLLASDLIVSLCALRWCAGDHGAECIVLCLCDFMQLRGFERVKTFHLTAEPFSVQNNILTPTFKVPHKLCYNGPCALGMAY